MITGKRNGAQLVWTGGWSLWLRQHQTTADETTQALGGMLSPGPGGRWPAVQGWTEAVNQVPTKKGLACLESSETRDRPLGEEKWLARTVEQLGLEHTVRREGRPARTRREGQS